MADSSPRRYHAPLLLRAETALVFACVLGGAPAALAQPQTSALTLVFEGGLTDTAGNDVAKANVVVTGPSGASRAGVTDQLGRFSISGPYLAGTYTVVASEEKRSVSDTVNVPNAPNPPDDRAVRVHTYVVNLAFDGGSKVTGAYLIPVYFATSRRQIVASQPRFGEESNDQGKELKVRTSLTRHSYYSDNRSILSDIRLVTASCYATVS